MQKITFENLPNTNTPVSAQNLNLLQENVEDGIDEAGVVVSPTEPVTDRKKVWLQKGKNYFNKNNYNMFGGYVGFGLNLEKGKTYTLSSNNTLYVAKFSEAANGSGDIVGPQKWGAFTSWTFVAGDNTAQHLNNTLYLGITQNTVSSNISDFNNYNIQIEEGSEATEYEPYVEDKTYILNDNNVYEEFKQTEELYSEYETKIGIWKNKPLYRMLVEKTVPATTNLNYTLSSLGINDADLIIVNVGKSTAHYANTLGGAYSPISFYISETDRGHVYINANKQLIIQNQSNAQRKYSIIIDYTKTTD